MSIIVSCEQKNKHKYRRVISRHLYIHLDNKHRLYLRDGKYCGNQSDVCYQRPCHVSDYDTQMIGWYIAL